MFNGFNVLFNSSKTIFNGVSDEYLGILQEQKNHVERTLDSFYLPDGSIDAKKLKEAWFPQIKGMHAFISHSHQDIYLAERFACWLYDSFGIKSFIDSHVWGHANKLLKEIDNKHSIKADGKLYDYDIRNITTSNIHMLLSSALNSVMDSCECLFFINTDKSISKLGFSNENKYDEDRTTSPWIMSELVMSSIIRKHEMYNRTRRVFTMDSLDGNERYAISESSKKFSMLHQAPTAHLFDMKDDNFATWIEMNNGRKEYDSLSVLYNFVCNDKIVI